jgi:hypothetical protein
VLAGPVDAGLGEGDELVGLLQTALGCVIHEMFRPSKCW